MSHMQLLSLHPVEPGHPIKQKTASTGPLPSPLSTWFLPFLQAGSSALRWAGPGWAATASVCPGPAGTEGAPGLTSCCFSRSTN